MAYSNASTVDEYLASLPPERRPAIEAVREMVLRRLPDGYEERMQNGMIAYVVPLERYPVTYNKEPLMLAALASQKSYDAVYLMSVYGDPATERWFVDSYRATGKRLDMGKSCVRFRKLDDLPLELVGDAIARMPVDDYIRRYESARGAPRPKRR